MLKHVGGRAEPASAGLIQTRRRLKSAPSGGRRVGLPRNTRTTRKKNGRAPANQFAGWQGSNMLKHVGSSVAACFSRLDLVQAQISICAARAPRAPSFFLTTKHTNHTKKNGRAPANQFAGW